MRFAPLALLLTLSIFGSGCASYARFPDETSVSAGQLLRDFGAHDDVVVIGPEVLKGNTLRSENKMFISDKSVQKRYFGSDRDIVYIQDWGLVAYGFIPLPSGDDASKGDVCPYSYVEGVFLIPASEDCIGPEKLIVTEDRSRSEYVCWVYGKRTDWPGWSKWDCTVEYGNTLKLGRR